MLALALLCRKLLSVVFFTSVVLHLNVNIINEFDSPVNSTISMKNTYIKGDPLSYRGIKMNGAKRFNSMQKTSCLK